MPEYAGVFMKDTCVEHHAGLTCMSRTCIRKWSPSPEFVSCKYSLYSCQRVRGISLPAEQQPAASQAGEAKDNRRVSQARKPG